MKISLCMIVRDEENTLARCLSSVKDLVDEIVIVDTGSIDSTKKIAEKYTDKIYDFEWIDDFSAARNFAFSHGSKEYLMWLDADDIIEEKEQKRIIDFKKNFKDGYDVILMNYQMTRGEDIIDTFVRERIVKRSLNLRWEGDIHETIDYSVVPREKLFFSEIRITHLGEENFRSTRNLKMLESKIKQGKSDSRLLYYYAQELYAHERISEAIAQFEAFFAFGGGATQYALYSCMHLHNLYLREDRQEKALALSLTYANECQERSEFCCQLGDYYKNVLRDLDTAIEWYDKATKCPRKTEKYQNTLERFYYYVPYYNLGQIYRNQGELEKTKEYLQKALEYLQATKAQ